MRNKFKGTARRLGAISSLFILGGAALPSACSSPDRRTADRVDGDVRELGAKLQNGYPAGGQWDAVAVIPAAGCTGTLIGDRVLLTAAHCFAGPDIGCSTLDPTAYAADFADDDGDYVHDDRVGATKIAVDPAAHLSLVASYCCPHLDQGEYFTDSNADFALIGLEANPVVNGHAVAGIPVMVPAAVAQQLPGAPYVTPFAPSAAYPTYASWLATKPVLAEAGYGCGSTPETGGTWGRDAGLETYSTVSGGAETLYPHCSSLPGDPTSNGVPNGGQIYTIAGDVLDAEFPNGGFDALPPGGKDPAGGVQSWACPGDSGGPLLAGKGDMPAQRPSADLTALPAPAPRSIVGVASRAWDDGTHPGADFASTVTDQAASWIANVLRDNDHDGTPDFVDDTDPDGDGIPTSQDNCPTVSNTNQWNQDGDAFGDSCDVFPCATDLDFDLVPDACAPAVAASPFCANACAGYVGDNCPTVWNYDQANCNALSEAAHGSDPTAPAVLGDACDPVPCPLFDLLVGTNPAQPPTVGSVSHSTLTTSGVSHTVTTTQYTEPVSGFGMKPVGSHGAMATSFAGWEDPVTVTKTDMRHCNKTAAQACTSSAANISDTLLGTSRSAELSTTAWNRMDMNAVTEGYIGSRSYLTGTEFQEAWNQPYDYADWIGRFGTGWLASPPTVTNQGPGSFWVHAESTVGQTTVASKDFHPQKNNSTVVATGLANHYEDAVAMGALTVSTIGGPVFQFLRAPFRAFDRDCYSCTVTLPNNGWLVDPPLVVIPDSTQPNLTGALVDGGQVQGLGTYYSTAVVNSLLSGNTIAEQVEVGNGSGQHHDVGMGRLINAGGNGYVNDVFARGGKIIMASELPGGVPHTIVAPASAAAEAEVVGGIHPNTITVVTRIGFLPIYSRTRGRAWIVGGTDASTGLPVRTILNASTAPAFGTYVPSSTVFTPYKVLGATYSPHLNKLILLDEGTDSLARLAVVDPDTGSAQVVRTWTRARQYDKLWLALDKDGSILIEGSSTSLNVWRIARISLRSLHAPDTFGVDNVADGTASLEMQPMVGEFSYTFAEHVSGGWPHVHRLRSLPVRTAPTWAMVGAML